MAQWVPDCKAKSSKGSSVSNFVENLRERGQEDCGLTMDFQFWILLKIQRGMILGGSLDYCSAVEIFLKSDNEDFQDLKIWGLKRSDNDPRHWAPSTSFRLRSKDDNIFNGEGCRVGALLKSSTLEILLVLSSGLEGSKGNHIVRHRYHPLPVGVLMSQVLLVQPRTEDG